MYFYKIFSNKNILKEFVIFNSFLKFGDINLIAY